MGAPRYKDAEADLDELSIEQIILGSDNRGISALRPYLPDDYCADAARLAMARNGTVLIATGFYILSGNAVETDGPPGALAIGRALGSLGREVVYVTDPHGAGVMRAVAGDAAVIVEFPVAGATESDTFAQALASRYEPSLLVAIERCGASADGLYRNMRGVDISEHTAKLDALFGLYEHTIGIGDGGNEIGMGKLADRIPSFPKLPPQPTTTSCEKLVIASVSNWGGYGLVAALSRLAGCNLLPSVEEEASWVRRCVAAGAVDGFSGERAERVDGFELDAYGATLAALHALLDDEGLPR